MMRSPWVPPLFVYQLGLVVLVCVFLMLCESMEMLGETKKIH